MPRSRSCTIRVLALVWRMLRHPSRLRRRIRELEFQHELRRERVTLLEEQLDAFRDSLQALQMQYRVMGALYKTDLVKLSSDPRGGE